MKVCSWEKFDSLEVRFSAYLNRYGRKIREDVQKWSLKINSQTKNTIVTKKTNVIFTELPGLEFTKFLRLRVDVLNSFAAFAIESLKISKNAFCCWTSSWISFVFYNNNMTIKEIKTQTRKWNKKQCEPFSTGGLY